MEKNDIKYMDISLDLAIKGINTCMPNPRVGCVIVKNNEIISIGQTGFGGTPHAESNAIKNSNMNLQDSKMYVTLEPCNYYGKTPPCTNLIIKKKIREVFYSVEDIDDKVKGKSFKILKSKGIVIKKGLLKNQINSLIELENIEFQKRNYTRILTKVFPEEYKEFVSLNL